MSLCGTPDHLAPEFTLGDGQGAGVDCWAMGAPLHLAYGGWGGQAGGDIQAVHLHQGHLPRLLLLGAGGLRHQAAEQA